MGSGTGGDGLYAYFRESTNYTPVKPNIYYRNPAMDGLPVRIFGTLVHNNSLHKISRNIIKQFHARGISITADIDKFFPGEEENFHEVRRFVTKKPTQKYIQLRFDQYAHRDKTDKKTSLIVQFDSPDSFNTRDKKFLNIAKNKTDLIITWSKFGRDQMIKDGIPGDKVYYASPGVDHSIYNPSVSKIKLSEVPGSIKKYWNRNGVSLSETKPFIFLMNGMMQKRKGVAEALEAYCKAFKGRNDVLLFIRGCTDSWGRDQRNEIEKIVEKNIDSHPPILWVDGRLSEEMNASLLRSVDCLLSPHRYEGFGMHLVEAMSVGTPVLSVNYSGPKSFLNHENSWLVEPNGTKKIKILKASGEWCTYSIDSLARKMKEVLLASTEEKSCKIAKAFVSAQQFTWENFAEKVIEIIEKKSPIGRISQNQVKQPLVSICIPVRNGLKDAKKLLKSWKSINHGFDTELIIIDDHSSDGTYGYLKSKSAEFGFTVKRVEKRQGAPYCRNRAFELAKGEYIFSGDIDLEFIQGGWLSNLMAGLDTYKNCAMVAPKLLDKKGLIQSAGGTTSSEGIPGANRFFGKPRNEAASTKPYPILYATGAAMLFKASLLSEVGSWWEEYRPTTYDDVDFCFQVKRTGKLIWYCPSSELRHNEGSYRKKNRRNDGSNNKEKFLRYWPKANEVCVA